MIDRKVRLNRRPSRRKPREIEAVILRQLDDAGKPLSVYDLSYCVARTGDNIIPMQVYRTLARLIERGEVLRVESLSAYVRSRGQADSISICRLCHGVVFGNDPGLIAMLGEVAATESFRPVRYVVEIFGLCANCSSADQRQPADSALRRSSRAPDLLALDR